MVGQLFAYAPPRIPEWRNHGEVRGKSSRVLCGQHSSVIREHTHDLASHFGPHDLVRNLRQDTREAGLKWYDLR